MKIRPYLKLAARATKANVTRLAFPMKLTFCITYWCNYKCQTCNIWKMQPRDELTLDEIRLDRRYRWRSVAAQGLRRHL